MFASAGKALLKEQAGSGRQSLPCCCCLLNRSHLCVSLAQILQTIRCLKADLNSKAAIKELYIHFTLAEPSRLSFS